LMLVIGGGYTRTNIHTHTHIYMYIYLFIYAYYVNAAVVAVSSIV
jgi:hypothetical protein